MSFTQGGRKGKKTYYPYFGVEALLLQKNSFIRNLLRPFAKLVDKLTAFNSANQVIGRLENRSLQSFVKMSRRFFRYRLTLDGSSVLDFPKMGGCLVLCSHPTGMLDFNVLLDYIGRFRQDIKVMTYHRYPKSWPWVIGGGEGRTMRSIIKDCQEWLKSGGVLVIFPAGLVSKYCAKKNLSQDLPWQPGAVSLSGFAKHLVCLNLQARNSRLFYWWDNLHTPSRRLLLAREAMNKRGHHFVLHTSPSLPQRHFKHMSRHQLLQFTERLHRIIPRYANKPLSYLSPSQLTENNAPLEPLDDHCAALQSEIDTLMEQKPLFSIKERYAYCIRAEDYPVLMPYVYVLREKTFRQNHMGSGDAMDYDQNDDHMSHVVIVDKKTREICASLRYIVVTSTLRGAYCCQRFGVDVVNLQKQGEVLEFGRVFVVEKFHRDTSVIKCLYRSLGQIILNDESIRFVLGSAWISKVQLAEELVPYLEAYTRSKRNRSRYRACVKKRLHPSELQSIDGCVVQLFQHCQNIFDFEHVMTSLFKDYKRISAILKLYAAIGCEMLAIQDDQTPQVISVLCFNDIACRNVTENLRCFLDEKGVEQIYQRAARFQQEDAIEAGSNAASSSCKQ